MKNTLNRYFLSKSGLTIKSIAFNAVEKDLSGYLIKNNKSFNIAGKLSLNQWRGNQMWSLLSMIFLLIKFQKYGPIVYRLDSWFSSNKEGFDPLGTAKLKYV